MANLAGLMGDLKRRGRPNRAVFSQRFFKTGPGEYAAGDIFLGLTVPEQRQLARKYKNLDRREIRQLLVNQIHEFRLVGLLVLTEQYTAAKEEPIKKKLVDFYLQNTERINNWDLVDLTAYKILGDFLTRQNNFRPVLDKLVKSKNIWERRIAMIATYAFIRAGRPQETFRLAAKLLRDKHDLIHKAVGWMLREAGKRTGEVRLLKFLDEHARQMPRTMLRYAIERLSPALRKKYLSR